MKLSLRILVTCLFLMLATQASAVYTQDGERKSFDISRTDSAPVIDGKLDDDVWKYATTVNDFHMT